MPTSSACLSDNLPSIYSTPGAVLGFFTDIMPSSKQPHEEGLTSPNL